MKRFIVNPYGMTVALIAEKNLYDTLTQLFT